MKRLTARQYAKMLYTAIEKGTSVSDSVKGMIGLMFQLKQLKLARKVAEEFSKLYNEKNNILSAKIESARKLDESVVTELRKWISKTYESENIDAEMIIMPGLKGGVVVRVGDEKLDLSISRKIEELKEAIRG